MSDRRVVLITGASSGIGRSCADVLAERGFDVFGAARSADRLATGPAGWRPVRMDVADDRSVEEAVGSVVEERGRIDVLINNAGYGLAGAIEETSVEDAVALLQTDLLGILRTCRAVLPTMRAHGAGLIVNVSSLAGRIALPFQGIYSAAKFAVEALSEALRIEVAPFGIRVVLVEPGDTRTPFTQRRVFVRSPADSPYAQRMRRAIGKAETDERGGIDPVVVARLVFRIAQSRSPRVRYTVGSPFQRAAAHLKSWLPAALYERFLATYYGVR